MSQGDRKQALTITRTVNMQAAFTAAVFTFVSHKAFFFFF